MATDKLKGLDCLISLGLTFIVSMIYFQIFFARLIIILIVSPLICKLCIYYRKEKQQKLIHKKLRDSLDLLTLYLRVGYSLTEATKATTCELKSNSLEADDFLIAWLDAIRQLDLNRTIGDVYYELAHALKIKQAYILAGILETGLKAGANLIQITEETTSRIQDQLDYQASLSAQLATRSTEGLIMLLAPLILTVLMTWTMADYIAPLYQGKGCWVMLFILVLQLFGGGWFFIMLNFSHNKDADVEVADFMDCLALLLQAGLSLPAAWRQAALMQEKMDHLTGRTAFGEIVQKIMGALELNGSMAEALNLLEQQAKGRVIARFASLLKKNLRNGGNNLTVLLNREANHIRQKQLLILKMRGSRQEIWLIFPIVIMLLSCLLLTAAPALIGLRT